MAGIKFRYPQDVVWRQKDGTFIKLGEMTDTHLMNVHRLIKRKEAKADTEAVAGYSYGGNPDSMGSYYAEQAGDEALSQAVEHRRRAGIIMDELRRRYPDDTSVRSYVERFSGRRVQRRANG